jgi:ATP-binding cassette, subfamily B, bacterial MsbA
MTTTIKTILRSASRRLATWLGATGEGARVSLRISARLGWDSRRTISVILVSGVLAALFEGATLVGLYAAVKVAVDGPQLVASGLADWIPSGIVQIFLDFGKDTLFLSLLLIAIFAQLSKSVLDLIAKRQHASLTVSLHSRAQRLAVHHLMKIGYLDLARLPAGEVAALMEDVNWIMQPVLEIVNVLRNGFMLVTYLGAVVLLSLEMTIVAAIIIAIFWITVGWIIRKLDTISKRQVAAEIETNQWQIEFINSPRVIRIFDNESLAEEKIALSRDKWLRARRSAELIRVSIEPALDITAVIGVTLVLVGGYFVTKGNSSDYVATLFVYVLAFLRAKPFLKYFNEMRARLIELLAYLERAGDFLRVDNKKMSNMGGDRTPDLEQTIEFRGVSFQYNKNKDFVLEDISFDIQKGKITAIVGETGSGKSTILDLILGLIHPTTGEILIDGISLDEVNLQLWRRQIGVVDQHIVLSGETVGDMIKFGKPNATQDEIERVAKAAYADGFIQATEKGYENRIGDRGFGLSGGQQQRLALARALIRDPKILILDEATSALDAQSEEMIHSTLSQLSEDITIIMVAHRLTTIRNADQVVVIEKGKISEKGSIAELLKNNGNFSRMWRNR